MFLGQSSAWEIRLLCFMPILYLDKALGQFHKTGQAFLPLEANQRSTKSSDYDVPSSHCVALSGMSYLDLMHGISDDKKPKNVGKFPLLSVDTLAGGHYIVCFRPSGRF